MTLSFIKNGPDSVTEITARDQDGTLPETIVC